MKHLVECPGCHNKDENDYTYASEYVHCVFCGILFRWHKNMKIMEK